MMMTKMREIAKRKNQKGLAVVEYVIVLAVVAALAAAVFGSDGITDDIKAMSDKAKTDIGTVRENVAPKPKD